MRNYRQNTTGIRVFTKSKRTKSKVHGTCYNYLVDVKELIQRQCTALSTKFLDYVKKPDKEPPPTILRTNIFEALNVIAPRFEQTNIQFA